MTHYGEFDPRRMIEIVRGHALNMDILHPRWYSGFDRNTSPGIQCLIPTDKGALYKFTEQCWENEIAKRVGGEL